MGKNVFRRMSINYHCSLQSAFLSPSKNCGQNMWTFLVCVIVFHDGFVPIKYSIRLKINIIITRPVVFKWHICTCLFLGELSSHIQIQLDGNFYFRRLNTALNSKTISVQAWLKTSIAIHEHFLNFSWQQCCFIFWQTNCCNKMQFSEQ